MKNKKNVKILIFLGVLFFILINEHYRKIESTYLYQVSTLQSLMAGGYDGSTTVRSIPRYGDTGLGTFTGLDGEMIVIDGTVYKAKTDGNIYKAEKKETTPFANVAFIKSVKETKDISFADGYDGLQKQINNLYPRANMPVVFRIDGEFNNIVYRSVPKQDKPYPPLVEVVKEQVVFEKETAKGSLVGFRFPAYFKDINVDSYHLHFISDDRSFGGHLLKVESGDVSVKAKELNKANLFLPEQIKEINSSTVGLKDIHVVEKGK